MRLYDRRGCFYNNRLFFMQVLIDFYMELKIKDLQNDFI